MFRIKNFSRAITMFDASYVVGLPPKSVTTAVSSSSSKWKINNNNDDHQSCHILKSSVATKQFSYEDAIKALNNLQSNVMTIQRSIQRQQNHIADALKYLQRIGITSDILDKLPIIHVSGTKGKGSTCALTESILRAFGIKTGFFSSPHLISVTERIRINGKPINRELFAKYFWEIHKLLSEQKENDDDMPPYFKFLTILSFKIFLEENVDVAVIEVGIGGENDCTNVVRNTKTVGITSLGLEHTNLLGTTMSEIAWQKAGIIKPNSNVFTTLQSEECMKVIRERAKEKNAKLFIAPDFLEYKWIRWPKLQIDTKVQKMNASVAIQLAYDWLKVNKFEQVKQLNGKINLNGITLEICEEVIQGLEKCFWPGRCQMIEFRNKKIFLDGAHTKESIEICCDWFIKSTVNSKNKKFLIFNMIGDRNSKKLLEIIGKSTNFTQALFVTNTPFRNMISDDINSSWYSHEQQIQRVHDNHNFWTSIFGENSSCEFHDILDALTYLHNQMTDIEQVEILVTGSLHLIGATLLALEEYEKRFYNTNSNG